VPRDVQIQPLCEPNSVGASLNGVNLGSPHHLTRLLARYRRKDSHAKRWLRSGELPRFVRLFPPALMLDSPEQSEGLKRAVIDLSKLSSPRALPPGFTPRLYPPGAPVSQSRCKSQRSLQSFGVASVVRPNNHLQLCFPKPTALSTPAPPPLRQPHNSASHSFNLTTSPHSSHQRHNLPTSFPLRQSDSRYRQSTTLGRELVQVERSVFSAALSPLP
jgi:hypothetical protein